MIYNLGHDKIKIYNNKIMKLSKYLKIFMTGLYTSKLINYIFIINISTNCIFNVEIAKLFKLSSVNRDRK